MNKPEYKTQCAKLDISDLKMPSFIDECNERAFRSFRAVVDKRIESKVVEMGYLYEPDRMVLKSGPRYSELWYYKTDAGELEPVIAFSALEVGYHNDDFPHNMVTMKLECHELDQEIFNSFI